MTLYRKLSRNSRQFLTVTGMNLHQFPDLLPKFTPTFERPEHKRKAVVMETNAERQRGPGGRSRFAHELTVRLLMLRIYYRLYLTQEFLTLLFKYQDKSSISRNSLSRRALLKRSDRLIKRPEDEQSKLSYQGSGMSRLRLLYRATGLVNIVHKL
jgi:hypothetical protein